MLAVALGVVAAPTVLEPLGELEDLVGTMVAVAVVEGDLPTDSPQGQVGQVRLAS
jgi:hypothetical protein